MKIFFKVSLFFILCLQVNFAQELFVCESYTEDGKPIGAVNNLEIKPYGKAAYVLLENKTKIDSDILYLFIDRLSEGQFTPYDSKTLLANKDKKWAVTNYEFRNAGIYELYFLNSAQKKLAVKKIEVKLIDENGIERVSPNSSSGFGNTKFIFCDMIVNDRPINPFTQLSISAKNGNAYAYVNNYVPFGTEIINIKISKRKASSSFDELISSKKYKITPKWTDTFFKLNFDKPGEYKIDVSDNSNKIIATNILTVTN
jgi:hypothetical protein